jgi:hypothetical protein
MMFVLILGTSVGQEKLMLKRNYIVDGTRTLNTSAIKLKLCLYCIASVFASLAKRYGPRVNSFRLRKAKTLHAVVI